MDTVATPPTLPTMVLPKPVEGFRFDKTEKGWTLVENVALVGEPTLVLDTFLREGEQSVVGHTMLERAKEGVEESGARAGQLHAERILEHQDKIPVEWRKFYLVFTGTVWRNPDGNLFVPYLYWRAARWRLGWSSLGSGWGGSPRLVRLGK